MSNESKDNLHSIAKRINGYFRRRSVLRAVFINLIICLLFLFASVYSIYWFTKAQYPDFTLSDVKYQTDLGILSLLDFDWVPPFDWVHIIVKYVFTGEYGTVNLQFDFNPIINASMVLFCFLCLFELLFFVLGGSKAMNKIRSYLKPIDDIALRAEQLSKEAISSDKIIEAINSNKGNLVNLERAINEVDSSDDKISINDSELSGLEAAVNNMLKRLDESNKQQIRFVDDASHELRTPISVIQGYANMLDRWGKDDESVRDEAIKAIKTESEHMKELVDQLLFLARGSMDRLVLERVDNSMCDLLNEIYEESVMIDSNHKFVKVAPESDFVINADTAMYKQCVRILIDNAIKYTPENGMITIKAYQNENGKACMEVADTGVGISKSDIPYIFDRFYRSASARSKQGSGLGLSIAKWIADKHGGVINAVSVEGVGTKMTIVI